ncbi:RNA-guided endonuclease InsQ/TnpB family protein [Streptomyces bluensis]|uniref:RNA-guided endonuclease InsQ/TnpB family protein n=1 Tax=Streptomyces bluensis TaxID=33897 RepID=UPI001678E33E|nr:RNA-guided endonuclease TnpB family protein [Streptomyces bluensis]
MQLRYAFRLYPDAAQQAALARAFGCARVVFNDAVRAREVAREAGQPFPTAGQLSTSLITEAKRTPERSWLGEVSAVVLQQSLRDAETAYRNFFASFVIDSDPAADATRMPETDRTLGIDLGLTHFAVLSDGTKIDSPRFLRRAEKKLKKAQQELSRKRKGSKNRAKARLKVARAHAKVADARREFHHQLSTKLISGNQGIAVEDLSVAGLARTKPAKSVLDAGWASFISMLAYKAERYGRTLVKIGRFEPTSQTCSTCGVKDGPKPLDVREWTCTACGTVHDRDTTAAINVKTAAGLAVSACGAPVRPGAIPAQREETGSHGLPTGPRAG